MAKIPCTCGCGQDVSPSTKLNHLNGGGTTTFQVKMLAESKLMDQTSKKRPFDSDQRYGHKRIKVSQLNLHPEAEVSYQEDPDLMDRCEASPVPESSSTFQGNNRDEDEDSEDEDKNNKDKDNKDKDNKDKDNNVNDNNEILGLSTQDFLGEDFECEVAALGQS